MKNVKTINKQSSKNNQKNMTINAGGDFYNGPVNKQEIVDNSWYNIPKEETMLYELIAKFIVSKLGEGKGFISAISLMVIGFFTTVGFLGRYLLNYSFSYIKIDTSNPSFKGTLNKILETITLDWVLGMLGVLLTVLGALIFRGLEHKNKTECPECKKAYSLEEVGDPKEKEIKTSKGFRVSQIRNYKCKNCGFEKESQDNFLRRND